jgi:hypothetical protein
MIVSMAFAPISKRRAMKDFFMLSSHPLFRHRKGEGKNGRK